MRLLLDTHAFVWATSWTERLSVRARDLIQSGDNEVWVSAVCGYEIELKRDRDAGLTSLPADLSEGVAAIGFSWLPIGAGHAISAGRLPRIHNDPFDRILAAQALAEDMILVTKDARIAQFGCVTAW